jgi:predicted ABC-type ATPase
LTLVNPDEIAKQLNPTSGSDISAATIKAGRLAVQQQNDLLSKKTSFAVETTLTGKRELRLMEVAKTQGYKVNLVFIGVDATTVSQSRVAARVQLGGHDVPAADVARRYPRSLANLNKALQLSDRAFVLDNSFAHPRLLLSLERGSVKFKSPHMPEWAVRTIALIRGVDKS